MKFDTQFTALRRAVARFSKDTSGSAVVDWVLLTAAIAGISIAVGTTINTGMENASTDIKRCMKIQGNLWTKDNGDDYAKRMKRIENRCSKL
ncbi:hypothetical protein [Litoreibacter janthinus]|uniref:Flp pilus assembly protein, pilin Flp n=1 Tax=Litoreibacter janthinus TaxID=670154 RepID=A0A1I6GR57_9RHOB|nr:hypothetical protein [Litoreibacter janthinus]SFR44668.1 hypothetical protein SAMN04488002_1871 [Litoreibacter janthinus]